MQNIRLGFIEYAVLGNQNFGIVLTGEPNYWPSDQYRVPDLLNFFITKEIYQHNVCIESSNCSDHKPVIITVNLHIAMKERRPQLLYRIN